MLKHIILKKISILCLEEKRVFYWLAGCFLLMLIYRGFTTFGCAIDEMEHIHASWLISSGALPYRDFFEHHNPLLWYIFAPVTELFYRQVEIIYVAHIVAITVWIANVLLVYKICAEFLYNAKAARFAVLILLCMPHLGKEMITFRPDTFMLLCFLTAVYAWFAYLKSLNRWWLIGSYVSAIVSFCFLQKIIVQLAAFGLTNIYFLYKKEIKKADFIVAVSCALAIVLGGIFYFHYNNMLEEWFYYNFPFNINVKKMYAQYTSGVSNVLRFWTGVITLLIIKYNRLVVQSFMIWLIWVFSLISLVMFAPHYQYYIPYWVFSSMILGGIIQRAQSWKKSLFLLQVLCIVSLGLTAPKSWEYKYFNSLYKEITEVLATVPADEAILSLEKVSPNLFNKNANYYWFGFHNVVIFDVLSNPQKTLDLSELIKSPKIKYIYMQELSMQTDMVVNYYNKYREYRNHLVLLKAAQDKNFLSRLVVPEDNFWQVDEESVKENFEQVGNTNIWKRIE